jgi:hypothetical protein
MSERTDRIIDDHLNQRPGARHAHQHDQFFHTQVETLRSLLGVMESEMRREGVPYDSAGRVLNGIMNVCLGDWEHAKLSRERLLLLAAFDTSEFGRPMNSVFTELAEGSPVRDDLFPEERPVGSEGQTS